MPGFPILNLVICLVLFLVICLILWSMSNDDTRLL